MKKRRKYPRITQDLVFSHVMNKEGNFELGSRASSRCLAKDDQGRIYDIEMQTTNKHDLEQRMPYYATGLNKFTLKSGEPYLHLKSSYVLFLCTFDPFVQGESIYEFEFFNKKTRSIEF